MAAVCVLATTLSGCAGLSKQSGAGRRPIKTMMGEQEPQFQTPSSMVAIWKPSTYEKPGTKSLRGFGGRFYFHDAKNEPIKVDGTLTIYGYDDASENSSGKADRKFVFKSDTFAQHHSDSGIGDSYSFWVPWDEVGGVQRTITLIPVFKSANGEIPQSQPATLRLPGKKREVVASAQESLYGPGTQVISASGVVSQQPMVRQAVALTDDSASSSERPSRSENASENGKTTTFRLPPNLAARIANADLNSSSKRVSKATGDFNHGRINGDGTPVSQGGLADLTGDAQTKSLPSTGSSLPEKRAVFGQPGSF